jgi:MOSC domain-containing protein YiiM
MSELVGAKGRVVSVNLSEKKTVRKQRFERGTLVLDRGFEGDAHAGDWHRQVSLLSIEAINSMNDNDLDVGPGDFAENITTEGIDVMTLPVGSVVRIGETVLEVSQVGKVCHNKCAIFYQAGDCVMPREGVFVVVRTAGDIAVGDEVEIIPIGDGTCDRSPEESLAESESVRAGNECRKLEKNAG